MSIAVQVGLLSGRATTVKVDQDDNVLTLKLRAQTSLRVGNGRLVDSSGNILDAGLSIIDSGLQDGGSLTLHIHRGQVCGTRKAFAAVLGNGSVVAWGDVDFGGDNSTVQAQLKDVEQIPASGAAFAPILGNGSVVSWGTPHSSAAQSLLKNVQQIQATHGAFAAILGDGTVVTWGEADLGGDSSAVQGQLKSGAADSLSGCFCRHSC